MPTTMIEKGLLEHLTQLCSKIVGKENVLAKEAERRPFECDGLMSVKQLPPLVVLPRTTGQIQQIVRLCRQHSVPLVPRGAGTGLSGGALPLQHAITIAFSRMTDILDIDAQKQRIRVQPGIANSAVSQAVAHLGLFYAPDPSSQIISSIGGNIAENAGGIHCLKYGLTLHNVASLRIVTADGDEIEISEDDYGYDLLPILIGSEGLLGIVVEATLKLLPRPEHVELVIAGFLSVEAAANAVAEVIASGIVPAGLEMMDKPIIDLVNKQLHIGYPENSAALLLCELDGGKKDTLSACARVEKIFTRCGSATCTRAQNEEQRLHMWKGRKSAFPAVAHVAPDYYCMDGTVPRKKLAQVLTRIYQLSEEHGYPVYNVFHAGDGNLHPLILYDGAKEDSFDNVELLGSAILKECLAAGGTITGEHGVGIEKLNSMCEQFTLEELDQFHRLRMAFDNHQLFNPGKAIPTLARCSEVGGMHVHKGQLPHADIERF